MFNVPYNLFKQDTLQLSDIMKEYGTNVEPKRVPVSLSPYLMSLKHYNYLKFLCEHIIDAIEIVLHKYIEEPELQAMFPELRNYQHLTLLTPPYSRWIHLARFDIACTENHRFQLLETNADCPGAIAWTPIIKQSYAKLSVYQQVVSPLQPISQPIDSPYLFIQSLVDVYQQVINNNRLPNIGFLSSLNRPILTDLGLLNFISRQIGLNSAHIPIQNLQICNNGVGWSAKTMDVAYQKFDAYIDDNDQAKPCIYEKTPAEVAAYWQGIKHNQFLYFNPFPSSLIAENKRILHLLQLNQLQELFSTEQRRAISEFCPLTFPLADKTTEQKALIKEVLAYKNDYVLKQVIDTQGRSVVLGCNCTSTEWEMFIQQAINRPYVIQKYIPHPQQDVYATTHYESIKMYTNLSMFMIAGKAVGLLCRSSVEPITNVARLGCLRPVYIIP